MNRTPKHEALLTSHRCPSRRRLAGDQQRTSNRTHAVGGGGAQWRAQSSAHRFLHERADPCLFGGSQLLQREGDRPQGAFVEVRRVAEA